MRVLTNSAKCAAAIRKELKENFPKIKFRVNSSTGDCVSISWVEAITTEKVRKIVNKYQCGSFNGMEDIYEFDNKIEGLPQVKFIQTRREISEEVYLKYFEKYAEQIEGWKENNLSLDGFSDWLNENFGAWTPRNYIYMQITGPDLVNSVNKSI